MGHKGIVAFIFLPILYAVLILGLVWLQFSGGSLFNSRLGALSISGSLEMGDSRETQSLSSISMGVNGLLLTFDHQHPLLVQFQDNSFQELAIRSYEQKAEGFNFSFDQGFQLQVYYQDEKQQVLQIRMLPPNDTTRLKSYRIPFNLAGLRDKRILPNPPGIVYHHDGDDYLLSLPPRSFVDEEKSLLVVPGDHSKTLRLSRSEVVPDNVLSGFSPSVLSSLSPKDYSTTLGEYITGAYNSWRTSRYNTATGTWTNRDSEAAFNEEIMVDMLAEAWNRDEYPRVFNEMRSCADLHPEKLSYHSAVFLGNLKRITMQLDIQDSTESDRLMQAIRQKETKIFLKPGIYQFAVDRGGEFLAKDLLSFIDSIDTDTVEIPILLGVMQNIYLNQSEFPELGQRMERFNQVIINRLVPEITRTIEGYFLLTSENQCITYQSLLAGAILEEAGRRQGDENINALGKALILSAIKLGDEASYLPGIIDFANGGIASVNKSLPPEDTYWMLNKNPAYPRHVSLNSQLGPGHWFYTIATVNSIDISPEEYRFNISFPRTRTHYLIFRGMPNIDAQTGMQLFGITWRNASNFEVYSKGRFYNPENMTLMIKYYDDSVRRDIIIWPK